MCVIWRLFWGTKHQNLGTGPVLYAKKPRRGAHWKKVSVAAYCSILAAYRSKMQHIGFFIEKCFKWRENYYLRHFIIKKENPFLIYQKTTAAVYCCIYAAYRAKCCILGFFHQKLHWMDTNSLFMTFCNKYGKVFWKILKKAPAAACCCILFFWKWLQMKWKILF